MEKPAAPNCYECIYRGTIPGNAHSCCEHPSVKKSKVDDNPILGIASILGGMPPLAVKGIKVEGNIQGIRGGWFMWPLNFDPVWLISCNGFKKQKKAVK